MVETAMSTMLDALERDVINLAFPARGRIDTRKKNGLGGIHAAPVRS
jgi:hypothetical protein